MSKSPMPKFMCKYRYNFLGLGFLNERVVDDNVLLPRHPEEISITVRTSFAPVNNIKFVQWKLESLGQSFHTSLELSGFQGSQFVEQREDCDRVDGNHENL